VVLSDVLYKVAVRTVVGRTDIEVSDIQIDSRKVRPGSVFVAVKGVVADGPQLIDKAIEKGEVAIV